MLGLISLSGAFLLLVSLFCSSSSEDNNMGEHSRALGQVLKRFEDLLSMLVATLMVLKIPIFCYQVECIIVAMLLHLSL